MKNTIKMDWTQNVRPNKHIVRSRVLEHMLENNAGAEVRGYVCLPGNTNLETNKAVEMGLITRHTPCILVERDIDIAHGFAHRYKGMRVSMHIGTLDSLNIECQSHVLGGAVFDCFNFDTCCCSNFDVSGQLVQMNYSRAVYNKCTIAWNVHLTPRQKPLFSCDELTKDVFSNDELTNVWRTISGSDNLGIKPTEAARANAFAMIQLHMLALGGFNVRHIYTSLYRDNSKGAPMFTHVLEATRHFDTKLAAKRLKRYEQCRQSYMGTYCLSGKKRKNHKSAPGVTMRLTRTLEI